MIPIFFQLPLRRAAGLVAALVMGLAAAGAAQAATDFSKVPGVVVNHKPASTGLFVGSPSLAILPDGSYLASHDEFGASQNTTRLFRSTDGGKTWAAQGSTGMTWGNLFVQGNDVYLMGASTLFGHLDIRKSSDNGKTWTSPTSATTGRLRAGTRINTWSNPSGYHTAPMPVVVHKGRIWRSFEDTNAGGGWPNMFRAFVMSAAVGSDLLNAASWTSTNSLASEDAWLPGNKFKGFLEGNVVLGPNGQLTNVLRVDVPAGSPEVAALVRINTTSQTASFNPAEDIVPFEGGAKKFTIRYDPVSKLYWTLSNPVLPENDVAGRNPGSIRNILSLMSSPDLSDWTIRSTVLKDLSNVEKIGFQYVDWQFDGDDIIALSRTSFDDGLGGARNYHDANFLTFHRIDDFRTTVPEPSSALLLGGAAAALLSRRSRRTPSSFPHDGVLP